MGLRTLTIVFLFTIRPHTAKAYDAAVTTPSLFESMFAAATSFRGLMIYIFVITTFPSALGGTRNIYVYFVMILVLGVVECRVLQHD